MSAPALTNPTSDTIRGALIYAVKSGHNFRMDVLLQDGITLPNFKVSQVFKDGFLGSTGGNPEALTIVPFHAVLMMDIYRD